MAKTMYIVQYARDPRHQPFQNHSRHEKLSEAVKRMEKASSKTSKYFRVVKQKTVVEDW